MAMSGRGVFAVDRGIWSDPDFADEPFTEREAFMWLVGEAAWKPYRKRADGKLVDLRAWPALPCGAFHGRSMGLVEVAR